MTSDNYMGREVKTDPRTLDDAQTRAKVIMDMFKVANPMDLMRFAEIMGDELRTPTEAEIQNPLDQIRWHSLKLFGAPGYGLYYAFFGGIGSTLVHLSPEHGMFIWVDEMPGDGADARKRYLEETMRQAVPGLQVVRVADDPLPVTLATDEGVN
jgi:hypothetical protein